MTWSLDSFKFISMDKAQQKQEREVSRPNMGPPSYKWLIEESGYQKRISKPKLMQMPKLER